MNYTTITINGTTIGLKFGMASFRYLQTRFVEGVAFNNDGLNEIGISHIIYSGYYNNCLIKDVEATLSFGEIVDWIESNLKDGRCETVAARLLLTLSRLSTNEPYKPLRFIALLGGDEVNKMHLRFSMYGAPLSHPQQVMKELGITYQHATPQSMGDQWWFWNCQNVPEPLPDYITVLDVKPHDAIGFGLSKEMADKIASA